VLEEAASEDALTELVLHIVSQQISTAAAPTVFGACVPRCTDCRTGADRRRHGRRAAGDPAVDRASGPAGAALVTDPQVPVPV
jgi:hypothetical protein